MKFLNIDATVEKLNELGFPATKASIQHLWTRKRLPYILGPDGRRYIEEAELAAWYQRRMIASTNAAKAKSKTD